ncbi:SNAP25 homologous SNAP30 [Olea europaea subsp. europaea]|uniref:SNAP25 homologous SNAP30 n=1 Tax=Olea europaea subsp. europaea TaxID=158383 RepID=A0A8S0V8Q2_OLEEU|nr:SNAP25 homologous SNAP30 [Olea europaea subsp. europaea]
MFGFRKSPASKLPNQNSVDPHNPFDSDVQSDNKPTITTLARTTSSNPFESDTESDNEPTITPKRTTSSEPVLVTPDLKSTPFDDDEDDFGRGASSSTPYSSRNKQNNNFQGRIDLESMSIQELESCAVNKAEETTNSVNNCLRIAEDIRQDGVRTLETLHRQGEQIRGTHIMVVDVDRDLSRGEKLLNDLGSMFSLPWKPKKTSDIKGPLTSRALTYENDRGKQSSSFQRERLGLDPAPKGRPVSRTPPLNPTNALQKVEVEKENQDDAFSELSNILGELKGMATDMGSELDRQNKDLSYLQDDVDELGSRVKGANQRARRLIGK